MNQPAKQSPAAPLLLAALALALVAPGCQSSETGLSAPSEITTEAARIDLVGLEQRLAAERGRVVVINFWATWCEPCRQEFPDLIALHRRYSRQGLTVLGISLDSPRVRDTEIKRFLAEQRPSFPVFIKTAGDDDAFIKAIDPDWSGALPATFVFDRAGARRQVLIGQQTLRSLEQAVRPLL